MPAHGTIAFLRTDAGVDQREVPVELVVPYTNPALTARALAAAHPVPRLRRVLRRLARGFNAVVTLLAVHVLPFPSPLECQEGIRRRLEAELAAVARTSPALIRARVVFARDRFEVYRRMLQSWSLVVVGARHRWWRTSEERFANRLAAAGHSVTVIHVR